jgi:hypothetical protein
MRSGTTLLGNIVDRHPDISIFVESFFIPRYYYTQLAFWPLTREQNRVRLAQAIATEPRSLVNALEVDARQVARVADPSVSSVLDHVMSRWAADRGAPRWGDKSPGYLTKLDALRKLFPDARYVHIYRDGRDVMLSVRSLERWTGWDTNAARIARSWERALAKARAFGRRHPDRYLEVRYENLIRDPGSVVPRVAEFAGLDFDVSMLEVTEARDLNPALSTWNGPNNAINPDNAAKWRTKAPPEDVATFEYVAGSRLREFGYGPSDYSLDGAGKLRARADLLTGRLSRPVNMVRRGTRFVRGVLRPGPRADVDMS